MSDFQYLDLDLELERAPNGSYRVDVTRSPAGNAHAEFSLPFSDLEIENVLLKLGGVRRRMRGGEAAETDTAKQFGGKLFDAVFTGAVRDVYAASLAEANTRDVGLRLRLHLDSAPELADLPWEFLYNSTLNRFLALSVKTPIVRFLDLPEQIRPLEVQPPLRVLVMISSPTDYDALDVEDEWRQLKSALGNLEQRGLVTLERLPNASLLALQNKIQERAYHIFHFIGHGEFDERSRQGELVLEDNDKHGRRVSAQNLGTILHDHGSLRLVVLNACEGARSARTDPFAGVAQTLVQQGIPGVIAMQFEISDRAANLFGGGFYQALALGYPVDAALAEVRKTIFANDNAAEWGTPVLYMRAPDGKLFDVLSAGTAEALPVLPVPSNVRLFAILGVGALVLIGLLWFAMNLWNSSQSVTPVPLTAVSLITPTGSFATVTNVLPTVVPVANATLAQQTVDAMLRDAVAQATGIVQTATVSRQTADADATDRAAQIASIAQATVSAKFTADADNLATIQPATQTVIVQQAVALEKTRAAQEFAAQSNMTATASAIQRATAASHNATVQATHPDSPTPSATDNPNSAACPTPTYYARILLAHPDLGCAHGNYLSNLAYQTFDQGMLVWRHIPDDAFYVIFYTANRWEALPFLPQGPDVTPCPEAQATGLGPFSGFGKQWCQSPDLRLRIGQPTAREQAVSPRPVQEFQHGTILDLGTAGVYILFSGNRWDVIR